MLGRKKSTSTARNLVAKKLVVKLLSTETIEGVNFPCLVKIVSRPSVETPNAIKQNREFKYVKQVMLLVLAQRSIPGIFLNDVPCLLQVEHILALLKTRPGIPIKRWEKRIY